MSKTPDYMAPIAGARAWRLAPSLWARMGGFLWSHAMINVWPDGEVKIAECDVGHPAPAKGCSCGVYAWYRPDIMHKRRYAPTSHEHIAGVVAGRGRVIRGDIGYWVAEEVAVLAFFDDGYPSPVVHVQDGIYLPTKADAAAAYGVPVIQYSEFEDFCDDYGLIRF